MEVKTLMDCSRFPVTMSVIIRLSLTMPLTFVGKVNFKALYKEGWSITGTLPEHI